MENRSNSGIVTYNKFDSWKYYYSIPTEYRNNDLEYNHDYISLFSKIDFSLMAGVLIDRTNTIPHPLNITKNLEKMPTKKEGYNVDFIDIVIERANELIKQNKKLHVLWSGGLDSTTILCSLLYHNIPKNQVIVHCNYTSIYESGWLYDKYLKDKFIFDIAPLNDSISFKYFSKDDLIISGCHGNHVTGAEPELLKYTYSQLYENYFEHVPEEELILMMPSIEASPIDIITIKDYYQYRTFNIAWTGTLHKHKKKQPKEICEAFTSFYGTKDFQNWFVSTDNEKVKKTKNGFTFKPEMSEFIYNTLKDEYYFQNKIICPSAALFDPFNYLFVLDNNETIYSNIIP